METPVAGNTHETLAPRSVASVVETHTAPETPAELAETSTPANASETTDTTSNESRLSALEARLEEYDSRIAAFNVRSSQKI